MKRALLEICSNTKTYSWRATNAYSRKEAVPLHQGWQTRSGCRQEENQDKEEDMSLTDKERETLQARLGRRFDAEHFAANRGGYAAAMAALGQEPAPAPKKTTKKKASKKGKK